MSATAPAPARTDAKEGYCSYCRTGDHGACVSDACRCPDVRGARHRQRPSYIRVNGNPAATAARAAAAPTTAKRSYPPERAPRTAPVWELVKEEPARPPPKPKKLTLAEQAQPLLEAIVEAGDPGRHRLAIFGSVAAARLARTKLSREFPEWEWRATNDHEGRPALYARNPALAAGGES